MSEKEDNDEASFDGLMSFSTKPPPADEHNARTVMAEMPEEILASLKAGNKIDGLRALAAENDAAMTRRARPFELEKAVAAAAERAAANPANGKDAAPVAPEVAAAISFSVEPPQFPPSIEVANGAVAPPPVSAPVPASVDGEAEAPSAGVPAEPSTKSRPALRIAGIIVLLAVAALVIKFLYPLVRHRLQ